MASPFEKLGGLFFAVEYQVVGLWNEILRQKYSVGINNGQYLIFPEARPHPSDRDGFRTDLSVNKLVPSAGPGRPWTIAISSLAFEAKGTAGQDWPKIEEQLKKWFDSAASRGDVFNSWAIGAKGPDVRVYKYISATQELLRLSLAQNAPQHLPAGTEKDETYDILSAEGWSKVDGALKFMAANLPN